MRGVCFALLCLCLIPVSGFAADQERSAEDRGASRTTTRPRIDLDEIRRLLAEAGRAAKGQKPPPNQTTLSLSLAASLDMALEHNLQIRIGSLSRDALEYEIPRAKALFHPTLGLSLLGVKGDPGDADEAQLEQSLSASVTEALPTGGSLALTGELLREEPQDAPQEYTSDLSLSFVQPLLRDGRVSVATRPIRDAEFDLSIEQARLQAEILRVAAETKRAFFTMVLAENVIAVTERAIERDRALIEASQELHRAGLVTVRDVDSAKLSLTQDRERLVRARTRLEEARNALLDVLGLPLATVLLLRERTIRFAPLPLQPQRWIATAVERRPEMLELEAQLAKNALNLSSAENAMLPRLDLLGSYGRSRTATSARRSLDLDVDEWSLGLSLAYPLGNVAARSALSRAQIEDRRLREELAQQRRQIELEVRAAVIKLRSNLARIGALTEVLDQAQKLLEVASSRFALGLATNFDITKAQEDLLNADTDLLEAIVDYKIGLAELEAAMAKPVAAPPGANNGPREGDDVP